MLLVLLLGLRGRVGGQPVRRLLLLPAAAPLAAARLPGAATAPAGRAGACGVALLPLALLVAFYAHQLGARPRAGCADRHAAAARAGTSGVLGAVLWSLALGCVAASVMLALTPAAARCADPGAGEESEITIRGPMSYAGPGSLGGTESTLRR